MLSLLVRSVGICAFIALCGCSQSPKKSATPTVPFEKAVTILPLGSSSESVRQKLEELGSAARYHSGYHRVYINVDHTWFSTVEYEVDSSDGTVRQVLLRIRPGAINKATAERLAESIDPLVKDFSGPREKQTWDAISGTYYYDWRTRRTQDVVLALFWDATGREVERGHITICDGDKDRFGACTGVLRALAVAKLPDLVGK